MALITVTETIPAPAEQVYKSFTEKNWLQNWFCDDSHLRAQKDGHVLFFWNDGSFATGQFIELDENKKVAFTWLPNGRLEKSIVEITMEENDGATALTLNHRDLETDSDLEYYDREWPKAIQRLKVALATGVDVRIAHRVIIGIFPGRVTDDKASELGLPDTNGTLVTGLVPGFSAAEAGIQTDDVIVAMNGQAVTPDSPMNVLVQDNKPGDEVEVDYFRGSEKHTVTLTLKGYPVPELSDNMDALAEEVAGVYEELESELIALFEGVSEEEASKKPAPEEWNAKEVIAHLIITERWLQDWMGSLMQLPEAVSYTANTPARIQGVTAVYNTRESILAEMKRAKAETVAIIRSIPEEFTQRKSLLWRINFQVKGLPQHDHTHFQQIKEALDAARQ